MMAETVEEYCHGLQKCACKALDNVLKERDYQKERWSVEEDQKRSPQDWANILGTWMGKVHSATYSSQQGFTMTKESSQTFKKRVTQLGAICLAALEAIED